jgi:hypothetical protein
MSGVCVLSHHHPVHAVSAEPHFSLLRLSAAQRLVGALLMIACLWLAVWWAL